MCYANINRNTNHIALLHAYLHFLVASKKRSNLETSSNQHLCCEPTLPPSPIRSLRGVQLLVQMLLVGPCTDWNSSFAFIIWWVTSLNGSPCVTKSTTGAHKSQPFGSESFLWPQFRLSCQDISNTPITGVIAHMGAGMLTHSWQITKQWNTRLSKGFDRLVFNFFQKPLLTVGHQWILRTFYVLCT